MNPCVDAQTHASKRRAATSYPIAHCFLEIDVCKRLLCMRQQDKPIHLATLSMQVAAGVEAWPHNSRLAGGGLNAKSLVPHHLKAVKVSSEHPDPRDAANASDKQCWRSSPCPSALAQPPAHERPGTARSECFTPGDLRSENLPPHNLGLRQDLRLTQGGTICGVTGGARLHSQRCFRAPHAQRQPSSTR